MRSLAWKDSRPTTWSGPRVGLTGFCYRELGARPSRLDRRLALGLRYESYASDPEVEAEPERWVTELVYQAA